MAATYVESRKRHRLTYTLSWTADGSITIPMPEGAMLGGTFQSDGNDGGGTLTWFVSNDGTNFVALGVATAADPAFGTPVTSATAAGAWAIHPNDIAWNYFKFTLASSTNPTLAVTFVIMTAS